MSERPTPPPQSGGTSGPGDAALPGGAAQPGGSPQYADEPKPGGASRSGGASRRRAPFTFLARFLAGALPVVFAMSALNVAVDPANLFTRAVYERGIADLLAGGRNVASIANHDDRLLQRFYARQIAEAPDVLVLGSSRALQIRKAVAGEHTFFNASVTEATVPDFEGILQLHLARGHLPRTVILAVDAWDLQTTDYLTGWKTLSRERNAFLEAMIREQPSLDETLGGQPSDGLFRRLSGLSHYDQAVADGSLVYGTATREHTPAAVEREAQTYNTTWRDRLDQRTGQLEPAKKAEFEALVDYLAARGTQVAFYRGPYHPTTYSFFRREKNLRIGRPVEDYIRALATTRGLTVVGSYDPAKAGVDATDFFDALHVRESGVAKMFAGYRPAEQ
ncbi:MAG: hypothetical protein MUQ56_03465 [Thermoleophilia bacterium]|nr:hypothetical protein [Thermoleophilia bacterium]